MRWIRCRTARSLPGGAWSRTIPSIPKASSGLQFERSASTTKVLDEKREPATITVPLPETPAIRFSDGT